VWARPQEQKQVGKQLAAVRRRAGLTQAEVARQLGKPQSFVSSYENGQRRVDLIEFMRISRALKADPLKVFQLIVRART
jgi:transcriptional regulator with XRE-family HTH domain